MILCNSFALSQSLEMFWPFVCICFESCSFQFDKSEPRWISKATDPNPRRPANLNSTYAFSFLFFRNSRSSNALQSHAVLAWKYYVLFCLFEKVQTHREKAKSKMNTYVIYLNSPFMNILPHLLPLSFCLTIGTFSSLPSPLSYSFRHSLSIVINIIIIISPSVYSDKQFGTSLQTW